jgi:hypothetical protein
MQFFKPNIKKKYKNINQNCSNYNNLIIIENNNLYSNDIEYSMVTKNQIIDLVYIFCVQIYI